MDRISSLPDEIICHIVTSLSAKEAVFLSVLSKRFQNLFTIIPNLRFNDKFERFTEFLDGVLALPASSRIRNFSLECHMSVDPIHNAQVNRCICDVLKRGVLNLELGIDVRIGYSLSLPFEIFTSKTVVVLRLGNSYVIDVLPKNAFLPALKTLYLDSVRFNDPRRCAFQALLSACPLLEDLTIYGVDWERWKWSRTLSSPTLDRLTIQRSDYEEFDGSDFKSITFDTPKLTYLHYDDRVPGEYPAVNLDSLVKAKLDLLCFANDGGPIFSNPKNLFNGLRNVKILCFRSHDTVDTFNLFREAIPVFENLSQLYVTLAPYGEGFCIPFLPILLKNSPNLKTLVIKGPLHQTEESVCKCMSEYSCLLSCPVEVLVIRNYRGSSGELEQMKHFLGKLSCLRLVKIGGWVGKKKSRITRDLLMLPKASVNCKIQLEYP